MENQMPDTLTAFAPSGWKQRTSKLFMTHPPLEERIEALRFDSSTQPTTAWWKMIFPSANWTISKSCRL